MGKSFCFSEYHSSLFVLIISIDLPEPSLPTTWTNTLQNKSSHSTLVNQLFLKLLFSTLGVHIYRGARGIVPELSPIESSSL